MPALPSRDREGAVSAPTLRTGWLTGSACAGMFVFGIVMAVIGAVLPRLSIGLAQAGNLFFSMTLAMLLSQLSIGPLIDRFGEKAPLAFGAVLVAAALLLLAAAPSYGTLLASVALLGVGGGALNGATNTLVADLHEDPRRKNSALNLLGVFFGFGALFLPFVLGSLLERLGLSPILYSAAALTAAVAALYAVLHFPGPKQAGGRPLAGGTKLARNGLVLLFGFLLFFESGNEFTIGGYTSSYLTQEIGLPMSAASYLLAAYWGSMMLARIVLSRLLLRAQGPGVVIASALGGAAGILLLMSAHSSALAAAAVVLIGVSIASIYPTVLGLAGARFAERSGTVFGILFAIALVGGMSMPWAVGQIAQAHSLRAGFALSAAGAVAIAALQIVIARALRRP